MRKIFLITIVVAVLIVGYLLVLHHYNLDLFHTFLSEASGAAFGGFLGACIVWLVREGYVYYRKRPEHVVTYLITDNPDNIYGKLKHERGVPILGETVIRERLGSKLKKEVYTNGVWQYTLTKEDKHKSKMAFLGPFRYDLTEPGTYEASFFYFGNNFDSKKIDNPMLFHLEVLLNENHNYYTKKFDNEGKELTDARVNTANKKNSTKGKVFLHYKDFIMNGKDEKIGKIAKIRFYYGGTGEFEFKAYVPDSPMEAFQNVVDILINSQIYFYKIEINRIFSIEIPEAI